MASELSITWQDHSREKSHCKLHTTTLTPANVAAQETLVGNLLTALAPLTFGTIQKWSLVYNNNLVSNQAPGDADAQREKKMVVIMRDTTDQSLFKFELPCMRNKLSGGGTLMVGYGDDYDLTVTEVAALVDALEALVYSPHNHASAVERMTYTGKRT